MIRRAQAAGLSLQTATQILTIHDQPHRRPIRRRNYQQVIEAEGASRRALEHARKRRKYR